MSSTPMFGQAPPGYQSNQPGSNQYFGSGAMPYMPVPGNTSSSGGTPVQGTAMGYPGSDPFQVPMYGGTSPGYGAFWWTAGTGRFEWTGRVT